MMISIPGFCKALKKLFLVGILFCAACTPGSMKVPASSTVEVTGTVLLEEMITVTPLFASPEKDSTDVPHPTQNVEMTPTLPVVVEPTEAEPPSGEAPLRMVFPTPAPVPVSVWRPPLYPVPWAPTPFDHFYFVRPIAADEINWPNADYRYGGEFFENVVHTGVDIPAGRGTAVLAAGPGKVIWAGYGIYRGVNDPTDPYGLAVVIRHDFGYQGQALYTVYGHLDRLDVVPGQRILTSEQVGLVGETGKVTGPHLHFEIRIGDDTFFTTRNPELWIVPPQGWGVLVGQLRTTGGELLENQEVLVQNIITGQYWQVKTYNDGAANPDPYYNENLVLGDLPAGSYQIEIYYSGKLYQIPIEIYGGQVSYFTFRGRQGLDVTFPPLPKFTPEALVTPIP
jgi:murein DD-endopeptidase MepM/ murein hydrolase activator NlpD